MTYTPVALHVRCPAFGRYSIFTTEHLDIGIHLFFPELSGPDTAAEHCNAHELTCIH